MLNIILADHERVFRAGIASVLASEDEIRIVSQPDTPSQLIRALNSFRAQVVIISSAFLGRFDAIQQACKQNGTAILILQDPGVEAVTDTHGDFQGVVNRSVDESTLMMYVRQLARGGTVLHFTSKGATGAGNASIGFRVRQRLTPDELDIISNVVLGCKNREIAEHLGTTENSVKNRLRKIFDKVGVHDRLELTLFAVHHGTLNAGTVRAYQPHRSMPLRSESRSWNVGRWPVIR